jgi:hypothetical protein
LVYSYTSERNADRNALVYVPIHASVPHALAVVNLQHARAAAAPEQTYQQARSAPSRMPSHARLHMSIFRQDLLVQLKAFPRNVPRMMVENQDRPLIAGLLMSRRLSWPARNHFGASLGASESVGAGIHRIRQY